MSKEELVIVREMVEWMRRMLDTHSESMVVSRQQVAALLKYLELPRVPVVISGVPGWSGD